MKRNIHVIPHHKKWAVKFGGEDDPVSVHRTQEGARKVAVPIAKRLGTDVVIHQPNGRIRDRDSHGSDPFPPRDLQH
ncbi:MAG: DUF2188 domain-containing protein [Ignavibacteria bacterium]|nr:DUF2188 domain-containing protein [Ignavibacteria bacterium]